MISKLECKGWAVPLTGILFVLLIVNFLLFINTFLLTYDDPPLDCFFKEIPMNRTQRLSRILRRYASIGIWACVIPLVFSPAIVFLDGFTLDVANHQLRVLDVDTFRFTAGHVGWMLRTWFGH
jgi:hypothetical protein